MKPFRKTEKCIIFLARSRNRLADFTVCHASWEGGRPATLQRVPKTLAAALKSSSNEGNRSGGIVIPCLSGPQ
jgi:hypothetical protein